MRKFTRGGLLAYGVLLVALAALAVAGAASGNHWADYKGGADSHELVPETRAVRFDPGRVLVPRRRRTADRGRPVSGRQSARRDQGLNVAGGTLSWRLLDIHAYEVAAVVMKGGDNAMVYYYDAGHGGLDDSDTGITTPINTNGERGSASHGISHVDFCFDPKGHTGA